jgi:glyoxylase-like metal-dependent hydrolase (beta-lactamase superfamily II)
MKIAVFTFNDFAENTYVLYDDTHECVIVDPGCNTREERLQLSTFIKSNNLTPKMLINTHCHIDHVLGNAFVSQEYGLELAAHPDEKMVLDSCEMVSKMYGIPYGGSPDITIPITEKNIITFGETRLEILFTPGHSPASITLYNRQQGVLIAGDVLFRQSIGRTDLPGGDFDTLISSIKEKLLVLPEETAVYPGHGPSTSVGFEKKHNPFL